MFEQLLQEPLAQVQLQPALRAALPLYIVYRVVPEYCEVRLEQLRVPIQVAPTTFPVILFQISLKNPAETKVRDKINIKLKQTRTPNHLFIIKLKKTTLKILLVFQIKEETK